MDATLRGKEPDIGYQPWALQKMLAEGPPTGMHPPLEDLDPTWWGDSIGWYENGDTLVIDTIGTNGRAWLSQQGHPSTEKLNLIERYRRVNAQTLDFDVTIDDPSACTRERFSLPCTT